MIHKCIFVCYIMAGKFILYLKYFTTAFDIFVLILQDLWFKKQRMKIIWIRQGVRELLFCGCWWMKMAVFYMDMSSTLCKLLFLSFTRNDPVHQFQWLSPTGRQLYPHPQGTGWCTLKGPPRPGLLPGDRLVAQTPVHSLPTPRTPG